MFVQQIAIGDVDLGIGTDSGGSIRLPASWCGIVGHKPTSGLVPHTGIVPLDTILDTAGPMAKTVKDCALLMEVGHYFHFVTYYSLDLRRKYC